MSERFVEVVSAGTLTTLQDRGRPGLAHLGVPPSGALDPEAHARANRLVANRDDAATLEATLGGVALRFVASAVIAVTGATARLRVNGRPAGWSVPAHVDAGALLEVGPAEHGARTYVAVAGGFDGPATLGSRSTDLLSGLGPPPLAAGQRLRLGPPKASPPAVDFAPYPVPGEDLELPVHPGPRRDWLAEAEQQTLFTQRYRVSPLSNRIGLTLEGDPLERGREDELPSEGIVWGAVELLPNGQLVIFLADHPTTGGYPVVGVVDRSAASGLAQARPGAKVWLRPARPTWRREGLPSSTR